jgi:hypothetical protein
MNPSMINVAADRAHRAEQRRRRARRTRLS